MSIDSAETTDSVVDNQASADPVVADQAAPQSDSQPDTAASAEGVIAEDGSIKVDSLPGTQESSTTLNTTLQTPKTETPARNWEAEVAAAEKRIRDLQSGYGRVQNDLHQIRQQYQGVDPAAVAQWRQAQEAAKQQNLPVWNAKNPANASFQQDLARWKGYKEAYQRADTPEKKQILAETLGASFTPEAQSRLREWEQHQASFSERFAMDPNGTIAEIVQEQVQQQLSQHDITVQANTQVTQWFQDPANKPIIETYAPQMRQALADGVPWPYVRQMAVFKAQLERSQSREGEVDKTVAQARAQQAALRQKTAITRDGKTSPTKDVAAEVRRIAKEKGWRPDDPRLFELTHRLSTQS